MSPTADAVAVAAAGAVAAGALIRGAGASLYCCHCRSCNRTLEHCPAGITAQDELAVAARDGDHARFVRFGGMACLRCGACETRCDARLPLARMFGDAQVAAAAALVAPDAAPALVAACVTALGAGLVGPEYLAPVVAVVRRVAPGDV